MGATRQRLLAAKKSALVSVSPAGITKLKSILSGPLPDLPDRDVRSLTQEIREAQTPFAEMIWAHSGWAALYGWIVAVDPDCDPVVPAIHAIRGAHLAESEMGAERITRRVAAIAHKNPLNRSREEAQLTFEPLEPPADVGPDSQSVVPEAAEILWRAGVSVTETAWGVISAGVDIGVDWLDEFASSSGLVGEELFASARQAEALPSGHRLRTHFRGPEGRALVALLLGGDQWGAAARRSGGCEPSLVLWALKLRHAREASESDPAPPAPVARAWSKMSRLVDKALSDSKPHPSPENAAS